MNLKPIIRASLTNYIRKFELTVSEDDAFERFVNDQILSESHPGIFTNDSELLDFITVGGGNDLGFDGIAISVNGRLIRNRTEIDDILSVYQKGKFEITLIQSKNREKIDLGAFVKFTNGILEFLSEEIVSPVNDDVKHWHDIVKYITSTEMIVKWESVPVVNVFYVMLGKWEKDQHFIGNEKNIRRIIDEKGFFDLSDFQYIDAIKLDSLIKNNESRYEVAIEVLDSIPLPQVDRVKNSSIILCPLVQLVKMLSNDGKIRRNIFEDNVRDYQGDTAINKEIRKTLENKPNEFVLLNNGITIVCDEMHEGNRRISITNPQIVNGCQTCNEIFHCYETGVSLENAYVVIKVVGSSEDSIVNSIVKGTNRQNIVYDEAFEVTRDFHKFLEEFFYVYQIPGFDKVFYERRRKQYDRDLLIKPYQRANIRILIQGFVTLFLQRPEEGSWHESKLLQKYREDIFLESQSFKPYYLAAFFYLETDRLFKKGIVEKEYYTYKSQIVFLLKNMIGGKSGDINIKKDIEKYCDDLMKNISQKGSLETDLIAACSMFEKIKNMWTKEKGSKYQYGIKDNPEFTAYMVKWLSGLTKAAEDNSAEMTESANVVYKGLVLSYKTDKFGKYYGFIKHDPENVFFHTKTNPNVDATYLNKDVWFRIGKGRSPFAYDIQMVENSDGI